jgi:hypothetical protein
MLTSAQLRDIVVASGFVSVENFEEALLTYNESKKEELINSLTLSLKESREKLGL